MATAPSGRFGSRKPADRTAALRALRQGQSQPGKALVEFRLADGEGADLKAGSELKVDLFSEGQVVDVTGVTIGKGFAGTIKRHNFGGMPASHGVSVSHRAPGSIGQRQTPGRVLPGKRMSGHMGVVRRTTENLKVVVVDTARNLLLIRGAVPGSKGGQVVVRASVKAVRARDRSRRAA
jgi:large subunit ribosomal protein L3